MLRSGRVEAWRNGMNGDSQKAFRVFGGPGRKNSFLATEYAIAIRLSRRDHPPVGTRSITTWALSYRPTPGRTRAQKADAPRRILRMTENSFGTTDLGVESLLDASWEPLFGSVGPMTTAANEKRLRQTTKPQIDAACPIRDPQCEMTDRHTHPFAALRTQEIWLTCKLRD